MPSENLKNLTSFTFLAQSDDDANDNNDEDDDDEGLPRTQVSEGEDKATVFSRCKMGLAKQVSPKKT